MTTTSGKPAARPAAAPNRARPGRLWRWFLRMPPLAYRMGFAQQAGRRFLLLTTTGRRTGRPHTCGLNYVREGDVVYVFAGWGTGSDWYRNLRAHPGVAVQLGTRRWQGVATPVTDLAERRRLVGLLQVWGPQQGPPRPVRPLLRLIGFDYDAELRESAAQADQIPVVAIRPLSSP